MYVERRGLDSFDSREVPMAGPCERGNGPLGSVKT
jgi:hypothetical protein